MKYAYLPTYNTKIKEIENNVLNTSGLVEKADYDEKLKNNNGRLINDLMTCLSELCSN